MRSLELAVIQYREGITDFTTVLTAQQALLNEQDRLADTLGGISSKLVEMYRALGGGWEIRQPGQLPTTLRPSWPPVVGSEAPPEAYEGQVREYFETLGRGGGR